MKERIAEFIRERAYKPMTYAELVAALGISEKQETHFQRTLQQMESVGEVVKTRVERYGAPERMNLAVGRLQGHPKGFGFLVQDTPEAEDIFIGRESLGGAWHGDRIVARLSPPSRAGGRVEGEVIRILQRTNPRVVGTFESARIGGYVTPDDRRLADDIFVTKGATNGAKSGEKVVVQIVQWPEARRNAEGKVVERLGMKGDVGVDIVSVIRKYGLPEVFPPRVLKEAEAIPDAVAAEAITEEGRRDLRDWRIVTIDGEDAKDLDDAVNVERVSEDIWRLGVHIADVSYYVREGSTLDREAYARGTSVYLADRVVPMLPPKLSNGICSLNPQVDRLTLSCVMEIDSQGKVLRHEIFPSVIKTAARMTYTKVNEILAGDEAAVQEYEALAPMFREMQQLMEILRAKRIRRGALDFDLPEAKVRLNEQGWPMEIKRIERGISERMIEEFMLAANETVAEHCNREELPFMYRIHGEPAPDRLEGLREFLGLFGYTLRLPRDGKVTPKTLQDVTSWSAGRPEENLINSVLLRTMRQAVYSEENLGHFGLAADFYCHFTSPIRRYPDLVVHRVLRATLTGEMNTRLKHKWERWMPEAALHASDRERVAMEAERETIDLKKAEFMSDKVGESFTGIISGVSQFGFFVQLPNTVEGLVHVSTLTDDYYHFQEKFYALIGERTRRRFRLGDSVVVQLTRVDVETHQVDFVLDVTESPVVIIPPVASETRSRGPKNRARRGAGAKVKAAVDEAAVVEPAVEAEAGERTNRKRKRRKPKRAQAPADAALLSVQAAEPDAEKAAQAEQPQAKQQPQAAKGAAERTARKPAADRPKRGAKPRQPEQAERPARAEVAGAKEAAPRADRPARSTVSSASRSGSKVDMWGIPVPEGRVTRPRLDEDPGVVNPFSISPPQRSERGGRTWATRTDVEAPFTPAPATADEAAGLPGLADEPAKRRPARPRRSPRSGAKERPQPEA